MRFKRRSLGMFCASIVFLCVSAFCQIAIAGCVDGNTVSGSTNPGDQTDPTVQAEIDNAVLTQNARAPNGPLNFQIYISNKTTGYYATYNISITAWHANPNPSLPATPVYKATIATTGHTASGYPPASSGCPQTDQSSSTSGGAAGGGNTGGGAGGGLPGLGGGGCVGNCGTVTVGNPTPSP